ncbi:MAG: hypothetical protein QOF11_2730 [Chloroflexota bacterium]|jgi:hypothetical protein|nr:hypothetical protein [Chloroflexota bacterium]
MDFAAFPSSLTATYTGDDGAIANVIVHAARSKGNGVEYLCVGSDGRTYLLEASTVAFDDVPKGDPVHLGKAKGRAKKSR